MRIGIDISCWVNQRGYGRFTREMLKALLVIDKENEYIFFADRTTAETEEIPVGCELVIVDLKQAPSLAAASDGRRSVSDLYKFGRVVSKTSLDLFFYPSVYTYFPVISSAKKIVAIHDVIAETYPKLVFSSWKYKLFWDIKVWLANRQADHILTVSEFSKNEIIKQFGFPEEFLSVTLEAADKIFSPIGDKAKIESVLKPYRLECDQPFILYVGGLSPHKNLSTLLRSFLELSESSGYDDVALVLVGDYTGDVFLIDTALKEKFNRLKSNDNIKITGFISDDDLACFYNAASVFVLPSFCEGFGLPALEAMACGTPVIGSETTSLPEVVGEAGLYFDPADADQLTTHLKTILTDDALRNRLGQLALKKAQEYSWEKSARQTLSIFEKVKNT